MEPQIFLGKYRVANGRNGSTDEIVGDSLSYHANEIDSGKEVMVELVPSAALNEEVRAQLEVEAIAAQKLNHVNIAPLYDFGLENSHYVYVTERLDGTLAQEWVQSNGTMPVSIVLRIAGQIVNAIEAADAHHLVHRAINPSNVMLMPGQTPEGEWPMVKLLHFVGAPAKTSDSDGTIAAFDPALHYASPEQIAKGAVDFRSEIYSLGCTMWFLLTGSVPLLAGRGSKTAIAGAEGKGIPKKARSLLEQMLSANPDARAVSFDQFRHKLQSSLFQSERREAVSQKWGVPTTLYRPRAGLRRRGPMGMGTLVLAALLLVGATLGALILPEYFRQRQNDRPEKSIGKIVGVPNALPSVTPVSTNMAAESGAPSPPTSVAVVASDSPSSALAESTNSNESNVLTSASDRANLAINSDQNQTAFPAAPAPSLDAPPNSSPESASVAVNNTTEVGNSSAASVASSESFHSSESPAATSLRNAPKKITRHEVRRGTLVEPEVRPAEPLTPAEGPRADPLESTASAQERAGMPRSIQNKADSETDEKKGHAQRHNNARAKVAGRSTEKPEATMRSDEDFDGPVYSPNPVPKSERTKSRRWVRGRFVGFTPDGRWMVELPSNRIIIVPPPEEYR